MSGGSYDYMFSEIESTYSGCLDDDDMDNLLIDLCKVLKSLEWWHSADHSEEQYREDIAKFKNKWFGKRDQKLREKMSKEIDKFKTNVERL